MVLILMNQLGKEYIAKMEDERRERGLKVVFDESQIIERIMRLGREARWYEIGGDHLDDLRSMARATLIEDRLSR